ncbi:MAG: cell division protein FtsW [Candidatus Yonathbacteria bacterium]|nr:cell division protein FtsW [Candidatus Yonathbacteria bacterium]
MRKKADRIFLAIVATLVLVGIFLFFTASLGILARSEDLFSSVLFSQIFFGLIVGVATLLVASKIPHALLKKYSFYFFVFSVILTSLVFVPGIGFEHGGAKRWIHLFGISFQPAEFLKLSFVIYFAAILSSLKEKIKTFSFGLLPVLILLGITGALFIKQPDAGTFLVIFITAIAMLIVSGGRWAHIGILGGISIAGLGVLALWKPYILSRFTTFLDPSGDPLGAGYQIKQSLIAIGSGGVFGRGFGQSIQKFGQLPEPVGDSIFAVASEEFGMIGAIVIIALFVALAVRGFQIARRAPNYFSGLLVVGLVILMITQSFMNIASMLNVLPVVGVPLLFISHGGTALLFALLETGIILQVSKYCKN